MRFRVDIDSVGVAGFSEVSGLEAEVETEEYREGGVNTHTHRIPTRVTYPNLVLRRGVAAPHELWEWLRRTAAVVDIPKQADGDGERRRLQPQRKDLQVVLLDPTGADACRWAFRRAYPVRWEGPELRADQGTVAIETLELTHEGVTRVER
jgi:phage tail-like protein